MTSTTTNFYVTGGTMLLDAPSYIKRQTDDELYHALQQGEYCSILDSSQMGKSSLVIRVMERLKQEGIKVVYFSLQSFGTTAVTLDNWYGSLLTEIDKELELPTTALSFWDTQRQQNLTPTYCWDQVVRQIILGQCSQPIVFFLDEIGIVQQLPAFTDDFLLSLREFYNSRTTYPDFRRLTFCLIGTATPASLIKDRHLPPFNVGQRIVLADFTETEVTSSLAEGLQQQATVAITLLQRVWHWTNGHPYLTQRLCEAVANDPAVITAEGVDKVCQALFLASRRNKEGNLGQVEDLVKHDPDVPGLLELYRQIRKQQIPDDDTQEKINALRLTGIITVRDNALWVRNPIYLEVFDNAWVEATLPEAEKRRQEKARRRGFWQATGIATVVIAAIGGGIYWYWDGYVREIDTYCNRFVKRYGLPQCVGELTQAQVQKRTFSYRLVQNGRKNPVYKVQAITRMDQSIQKGQIFQNVGEIPIQRQDVRTYFESPPSYMVYQHSSDKKVQWEFVLDTQGKIVYEKAFNKQGDLLMGLVYSPLMATQLARAHYVGTEGFPEERPERSEGAEFVEIKYDTNGYEKTLRYFDRQHKPQPGLCGAFKVERQLDERGLMITEAFFDANGQPIQGGDDKWGGTIDPTLCRYHKKVVHYDEYGNNSEISFFGTDKQPSVDLWGAHKMVFRYDERGNQSEVILFNVGDKPLATKNCNSNEYDGFHRWESSYDDQGREIETAFFDIFGNLLRRVGPQGAPVFEQANFNAEGKPYNCEHGYHRMTTRRDEHGNVIEEAYFDAEGKPTLNDKGKGYHKRVNRYDEKGNQIEAVYFGVDRQPILLEGGYHKWTSKFDAQGQQIEMAYFDTEGRPILLEDGYHKRTSQFDAQGKQIEEAYFDTQGNPTLNNEYGYHKRINRYDEKGNQIEDAYFDADGRPILLKDGYHKWTSQFDAQGNQIEIAYFDADGKPSLNKERGYHKLANRYDENSKQTEEVHFDAFGNLTLKKDGNYNLLEEAYFDTKGKPIVGKEGYHKRTLRYNENGKQIEEAYLGTNKQPVLHKDGYHKVTNKYDDRGNVIEWGYFGTDGQPTLHKEGHHKSARKYDDRGNVIEWAYFGLDSKPVLDKSDGTHKLTKKYDDRGKIIEWAYFGTDGQPILHKDGYHKVTNKYDDRGKVIEWAYFGTDGQSILHKDGYHKLTQKFDDRNNVIEEAYFGTEGQPILHKDGYHKLTQKFDDRNNVIEEAYFGTEGQPILLKDGYHKLTQKFDDRNNVIEEAYFGTEGQPILLNDGYHKLTKKYDDRDNVIEEAYFGIDGQPTLHKDGYHKVTNKYDDHGNVIEWAYFGLDGKPVLDESDGTHKLIKKYDDHDNVTEEAYFDVLGNPTTTDGFHKLTSKYDDKGNQTEATYLDVTGHPLTVEVLVKLVTPDSQAEKLGLQAGDIFSHYDGKPVLNQTSFTNRRNAEPAEGTAKELKVLRDGKELTVMVLPGDLGVELENRVKSK